PSSPLAVGAFRRENAVRSWQEQREGRLARLRRELDGAAHPLGEFGRNRQPEAAARGLASLRTVEALEEVLLITFGNTWPVVGHREGHGVAPVAGGDHDARPRRSVTRCVLDENPRDLEDALLVGESDGRPVDIRGERVLARLGERTE